jgi:hypothetical protein
MSLAQRKGLFVGRQIATLFFVIINEQNFTLKNDDHLVSPSGLVILRKQRRIG